MAITAFRGLHRFLSNFYEHEIFFEGHIWKSVEHAFQAAKTLDPAEKRWVRQASTPAVAKQRGRRVRKRDDWEEIRVGVMLRILRIKFQDPTLRALLMATGSEELVEGNSWHDDFWGHCVCPMHAQREGLNNLGVLLMHVRTEVVLKEDQAICPCCGEIRSKAADKFAVVVFKHSVTGYELPVIVCQICIEITAKDSEPLELKFAP